MSHRYRDAKRPSGTRFDKGVTAASIVINLGRRIVYAIAASPIVATSGSNARGKGAPAGSCFLEALDKENRT
jgi:hypothetical protein